MSNANEETRKQKKYDKGTWSQFWSKFIVSNVSVRHTKYGI